MTRRLWISNLAFIFLTQLLGVGCALLGSGEDDGMKSRSLKFRDPESPYEKVSISSADQVWQSRKTGNTIAVNSLCQKYQDVPLDALKKDILGGIENLKITNQDSMDFNGREAQRVLAFGSTDGIPIQIDLVILKKNSCTYDLAYIGRESAFDKERNIFNKFINHFQVP